MTYSTVQNNTPNVCTNQTVRGAWGDWLRDFEPFDWYSTFTFREDIHVEQAERQYYKFIRRLNEFQFGKNFRSKKLSITHVKAIEYQRRGVVHFHALLKGVGRYTNRKDWEALWLSQHENNGFLFTYPYDPERGACGYLGKYVAKGGQLDIFVAPREMELRKISLPV